MMTDPLSGSKLGDKDDQKSRLAARLEQVSRAFVDAINNHELDYPSLDPRYGVDVQYPYENVEPPSIWEHAVRNVHFEFGLAGNRTGSTLEELLQSHRKLAAEYPDFKMTVNHVSSTVDFKAGLVEVYMFMDSKDMPPGVIRNSVGIMVWRRMAKKWRFIAYKGWPGMRNA